jgi:hypothetical protein
MKRRTADMGIDATADKTLNLSPGRYRELVFKNGLVFIYDPQVIA